MRTDWDDPRSWPPNSNVNPPPPDQPGVGPNMSEGFGNEHVMYPADMPDVYAEPLLPPPVMPWSGWPVEWSTPHWGSTSGMAAMVARISIIFGCIDLNSSLLATMPPLRVAGNRVLNQLPWMRNPQPEVYTGWTEAFKQVVTAYWGGGEAFLWCTSRYADGTVRTWTMLNPEWVTVEMVGQVRKYFLGTIESGPDISEDVLHIRYASWPGNPHGIGPLESLANNIMGVEAMERYQGQLASRGGIPWGVLTSPGNLTRDQAEEQRTAFVNARLSAMGAPAVLSGGVTLTPFNITPRDMAMVELRQMDEARISTILGVPPMLMGLPSGGDSMTYRNADSIYDFHWRAYLRPKSAMICEAIGQWALPMTQTLELNRDEYTRPALEQRAVIWNTLFNIQDPATGERAVTIEEIRNEERLGEYDDPTGGDELTPQQLTALGAPQEAIWSAAGVDDATIKKWNDSFDAQTQTAAQANANALSQLDPYTQPSPSGNRPPSNGNQGNGQ
jgi:HK97 family phage portal protein